MERYEYWVVKAPDKSSKFEGLSKADDPFAHTLMNSMNALARDGWQFLRTEKVIEKRRSFLRGASSWQYDYMVYRGPLRGKGMTLAEPVTPARVRHEQPPNIEMLRDRISQVATERGPVATLVS